MSPIVFKNLARLNELGQKMRRVGVLAALLIPTTIGFNPGASE